MSREKSLINNTILYMVANFSSKLLSVLLLPFYTHYFTAGEYGYFDLINTTLLILVPVIFLQINEGLYRYLLDSKSEEEESGIITNAVIVSMRNAVVFSILAVAFFQFKDIKHSLLILILINVSVFSWIWQQTARGLKNNVVFSTSGIVFTAVMLVSSIVFVVTMNMKIDGLLYSNILASVAMIGYIEWNIKIINRLKISYRSSELQKKLIKYSLPLLPNSINWWVMNCSSRYLINIFIGPEANGVFAVACKFTSILILVNGIFNLAWQESAITEYESEDKDAYYSKMFNIYMKIQFTALLVLLPMTKWMMEIMVDEKFLEALIYIPFLYIGTVFSSFSMFYGTGYLSSKETKGAFSTSVTGAVVNIIANLVFLPLFGLQAAAVANMVSALVIWLVRVYQTRKYFKIRIEAFSLLTMLLLTCLYVILYFNDIQALTIGLFAAALCIMYIFNQQVFKYFITMALSKFGKSVKGVAS